MASDLHLHGDDPGGLERALAFLAHAHEQRVDAVFLLGDVFRAWLGAPSLRDSGLRPVLDALAGLVRAGVRVVLTHGNHDFLMGAELERELGLEVHTDGLEVAFGGLRTRLLHGDAFCTRDSGYQRLHRVLRHPLARGLWGALPARGLQIVAERLLGSAHRSTSHKPPEVMAHVDAEVARVLARGFDAVVCGHVHAARDARLPMPGGHGRLLVMADFETTGSHVEWDGHALRLHGFDGRFAPPAGPVVTIDGPAGCGKSSVSRLLARRLGWVRLDSGALYRTVAAEALRWGLGVADPELGTLARSLMLATDAHGRVLLDGRHVPDERLRGPAVSASVSAVSAVPAVREALLPVQRRVARGVPGLVAEGRDMATVVFPDPARAVYLDARPEVRAARRLGQGQAEGRDLAQVGRALAERDRRDSGRTLAPLSVAPGAVVLDTSDMTLEQVVEQLVRLVRPQGRA